MTAVVFLFGLTLAQAEVGPTPSENPPVQQAGAEDLPRVGDPTPDTKREPTLRKGELMAGLRYGLVGTGPTRFVDDIRFGITDFLEVRTTLLPFPTSLMARGKIGKQQGDMGALLIEGGLAHLDLGFRLVPDSGEADVGFRFHLEGGVGYAKSLGERTAVLAQAHYRYRLSFLEKDNQHAVAVDGRFVYDLSDALAVSAGVGFATAIVTPVREYAVNFVETDGPGISHLLARDDELMQSVTLPLAMTYGRVENFDVDLFCTPRVWPEWGILFGAGVRARFGPLL